MPDKELVKRLLADDEAAFAEFFDSMFPRLYRFVIVRVNHDTLQAEDIVQATMSKAVTKLSTFRGEASLFSWLCTFCRHELYAYYKKVERTVPEIPLMTDDPDVRGALESLSAAVGPEAELEMERRDLGQAVQIVLDSLPTRYSDILEWKYFDDWSVKQIADRLEATPKAVEGMLARARHAFRDGFSALKLGDPGLGIR